ncbi:MAG: DNA/RNA non-specific endonuclease [Bacteroidaceae bacterium]
MTKLFFCRLLLFPIFIIPIIFSCSGGNSTIHLDPDPGKVDTITTPIVHTYIPLTTLRGYESGTNITKDVWVKASVISNGDVNNMSYQNIVISDGEAGITLRLATAPTAAPFALGDELEVPLKNTTLSTYNGLLQLEDVALDSIVKDTTKIIAAKSITMTELLTGNYESMYVAVSDVQVADNDLGKTFSDNSGKIYFENNLGNTFVVYTKSGSSFDKISVPQKSGVLKGIVSNYNGVELSLTSNDDYAELTTNRFEVTITTGGYYAGALELPVLPDDNDSTLFIHHSFTMNNKEVRSYELLYNKKQMYPIWVAYPLHNFYMGSISRTDAWKYDPSIPQSYQTDMFSGMGNGYDRGHMIPSADRTVSTEANKQTFYFSNMTCQLNKFNADRWGNTENLVRTWCKTSSDTIYVVTGAVLQTVGGNEKVTYVTNSNDGKKLPVPNYYYKVLLKRDIVNGKSTYYAIGFWFKHEAMSGEPEVTDLRSVDWIEEKTGLDFFKNLDDATEKTVEASYDLSNWGDL